MVFLLWAAMSGTVIVSLPVSSSYVYCDSSSTVSSTFIVPTTRVIRVGSKISVITGLVYALVVSLFISTV